MPEKDAADERHDDRLFNQLRSEIVNDAVDEVAPVVDGNDLNTFGEPGLDFLEPLPHGRNHFLRVRALADDDDAARHLAFAIQFCNAAAHFRARADLGHV